MLPDPFKTDHDKPVVHEWSCPGCRKKKKKHTRGPNCKLGVGNVKVKLATSMRVNLNEAQKEEELNEEDTIIFDVSNAKKVVRLLFRFGRSRTLQEQIGNIGNQHFIPKWSR